MKEYKSVVHIYIYMIETHSTYTDGQSFGDDPICFFICHKSFNRPFFLLNMILLTRVLLSRIPTPNSNVGQCWFLSVHPLTKHWFPTWLLVIRFNGLSSMSIVFKLISTTGIADRCVGRKQRSLARYESLVSWPQQSLIPKKVSIFLDLKCNWYLRVRFFFPKSSHKLKMIESKIPFHPEALWLNVVFFWGGTCSFQSRDASDGGFTVGFFLSKVQTHLFGRNNNWTFLGERVDGMVSYNRMCFRTNHMEGCERCFFSTWFVMENGPGLKMHFL